MSKDELQSHRSNFRFIFELRYDPLVQLFDKKGMLLKSLIKKFGSKLKIWKMQGEELFLIDNNEIPLKQMFISHQRCSLNYENVDSLQEFCDDAINLTRELNEIFPEKNNILRLGIRFISILKTQGYSDFNAVHKKVLETFFVEKLPFSIPITDCKAIFTHETGTIHIGPVKRDEQWVKQNFFDGHISIDFGIGIDVDSYAKNLGELNFLEISTAFNSVLNLTLASEKEMVSSVISNEKK